MRREWPGVEGWAHGERRGEPDHLHRWQACYRHLGNTGTQVAGSPGGGDRRPLASSPPPFVRNDRHPFDLVNLACPVVAVSGCSACESVWATVETGPDGGVWVFEQPPPPPPGTPPGASVRIQQPNKASVATRVAPPELAGLQVVAAGAHVGLSLAFDAPDVAVGELSYEGPTKSLIDDLGPLLGTRPYRGREVSVAESRTPDHLVATYVEPVPEPCAISSP